MARITIEVGARTSNDGYSDDYCGVQIKLVDDNPDKVELRLSERTDKLYLDLGELRKALGVLADQDD